MVGSFTRYLRQVAHLDVAPQPRHVANLPMFLRQRYDFWGIDVDGSAATAIVLREPDEFSPSAFEKHMGLMPDEVQRAYVLVADALPSYVRYRLVERRVPFVVPGVQMHWPDLGIAVRARAGRNPPAIRDQISPATQAVIVSELAHAFPVEVSAGEAAHRLGYSPMTMTRAFDELEQAGLAGTRRVKHERQLHFKHQGRELWQAALPKLRSPVRRATWVRTTDLEPHHPLLAGESALAAVSMLADPPHMTCAVGPVGWRAIRAQGPEIVPVPDIGLSELQIWLYEPAVAGKNGRVDPCSLYLSLREVQDERVNAAVEEMMERIAW